MCARRNEKLFTENEAKREFSTFLFFSHATRVFSNEKLRTHEIVCMYLLYWPEWNSKLSSSRYAPEQVQLPRRKTSDMCELSFSSFINKLWKIFTNYRSYSTNISNEKSTNNSESLKNTYENRLNFPILSNDENYISFPHQQPLQLSFLVLLMKIVWQWT